MQERPEELLDLALKSRDLEKKLEYCTEYLKLNPSDMDGWSYKGTVLSYLGRHEESMECHEKAIELIDDLDDPSYFGAVLALTFEDYQKATKSLDDVLREKPNYARAWLNKGSALGSLGRAEESLICLNKAVELGLGRVCQVEAWYEKGYSLVALGKFQEALRCFNNSLDIDPCDVRALGMKGSLLLKDEVARYEEALRCFNEALEVLKGDPENELAKLARGGKEMAEQKLGETGEQISEMVERERRNGSAKTGRPASKHCVKCHSSIPLDALYCTECGTKQ